MPGVNLKNFRPVAKLLNPKDLLIPMILLSILAQIVDNCKDLFTFKEVQKFTSVKLYSKMVMFCNSSVSLSVVSAISSTLSSEVEILSSLDPVERFSLLSILKKSLFLKQKSLDNISNSYGSPHDLVKIRKKLSLQFRSSLLSASLVYPGSLVLGLPVSQINLETILESAKIIWRSLGLLDEDFSFMLAKEYFNISGCCFKSFNKVSEINYIKMLCSLEFQSFSNFDSLLFLDNDLLVINSFDNLVTLERELGFLRRNYSETLNAV